MFLDSWFEYLNLKNGSRISDLSLHDPFAIFGIIVLVAIIPVALILLTVTSRRSAESIWDGLRHDARFRDLRRARARAEGEEQISEAEVKGRKTKRASFWLPELPSGGAYTSLSNIVEAPQIRQGAVERYPASCDGPAQIFKPPKTPTFVYVPDSQHILGEEPRIETEDYRCSSFSTDGLPLLPSKRKPKPTLARAWSGKYSLPSFEDKKRMKKYRTWNPIPQVDVVLVDLELDLEWTKNFQDNLHRTASESKQKTIADFVGSASRADS